MVTLISIFLFAVQVYMMCVNTPIQNLGELLDGLSAASGAAAVATAGTKYAVLHTELSNVKDSVKEDHDRLAV